MKALILAAGFGTRLAPHTQILPKALFPVAGTPMLTRIIAHLKQSGCTAVAINAHHLADQIRAFLSANDFGIPVHLSVEADILGTGGAIRQLANFWSNDPFLVVNADIVTDINLADAYRYHCRRQANVTMVMHDHPPFNQVWIDEAQQIAGFARITRSTHHAHHRRLAFTGIHVLSAEVVSQIPAHGFCDIIAVYQRMIDDGAPIHAHVVAGHAWQDIGTPQRYRDAVVDAIAPGAFRAALGVDATDPIRSRPLSGDGSDRSWWRLTAGPYRLIMADHGITTTLPGSEVNAFIHIGRHLDQRGLPVPRIHAQDGFSGLVFMDDLGDVHLQQMVLQATTRRSVELRYRAVIDSLFDLTLQAAKGFDDAWTCQTPAYDRHVILEKECRYWVDAYLNGYLNMDVNYSDLKSECEHLARCVLDYGATGLIHRDFQSRNIMLHNDRHYIIDFQGARRGPIQYDLASLLIDPYARLEHVSQQRLLDYACDLAVRRLGIPARVFVRGYRYCRVTRNLQMLGAFAFLTRVKGKPDFEKYIPAAADMLAEHIRAADGDAFPRLIAIAQKIKVG